MPGTGLIAYWAQRTHRRDKVIISWVMEEHRASEGKKLAGGLPARLGAEGARVKSSVIP